MARVLQVTVARSQAAHHQEAAADRVSEALPEAPPVAVSHRLGQFALARPGGIESSRQKVKAGPTNRTSQALRAPLGALRRLKLGTLPVVQRARLELLPLVDGDKPSIEPHSYEERAKLMERGVGVSAANYGWVEITHPGTNGGPERTERIHAQSIFAESHSEEGALGEAFGKYPDLRTKPDPGDTSRSRITRLYTERKPCESENADQARRSRPDANCDNLVHRKLHANVPVSYSVEVHQHQKLQEQFRQRYGDEVVRGVRAGHHSHNQSIRIAHQKRFGKGNYGRDYGGEHRTYEVAKGELERITGGRLPDFDKWPGSELARLHAVKQRMRERGNNGRDGDQFSRDLQTEIKAAKEQALVERAKATAPAEEQDQTVGAVQAREKRKAHPEQAEDHPAKDERSKRPRQFEPFKTDEDAPPALTRALQHVSQPPALGDVPAAAPPPLHQPPPLPFQPSPQLQPGYGHPGGIIKFKKADNTSGNPPE